MLKNYKTAQHILTVHRAGMSDAEYKTIIARVRNFVPAGSVAIVEAPSIAYICFRVETTALHAMLDLYGLDVCSFTRYVSHAKTVQYNYAPLGLLEFFGSNETIPQAS